jgi:hypothetical protein
MKKCKQCGQEKDLDNFHNSNSHPDKKNPYCKTCKKSYNSIYYATDAQTQKNRIKIQRQKQKQLKIQESLEDAKLWR